MNTPDEEKDAFLLIKEHGKEEAENKCLAIAADCFNEINAMTSYDADRVSSLSAKRYHWRKLASIIKNWPA